jgi:hypothetical protein
LAISPPIFGSVTKTLLAEREIVKGEREREGEREWEGERERESNSNLFV